MKNHLLLRLFKIFDKLPGNTKQGKVLHAVEYLLLQFLFGHWYYEKKLLAWEENLFLQALIGSQ